VGGIVRLWRTSFHKELLAMKIVAMDLAKFKTVICFYDGTSGRHKYQAARTCPLQIRSTKLEIRNKSELPKHEIQNEPRITDCRFRIAEKALFGCAQGDALRRFRICQAGFHNHNMNGPIISGIKTHRRETSKDFLRNTTIYLNSLISPD
jgi:hypothetical protein